MAGIDDDPRDWPIHHLSPEGDHDFYPYAWTNSVIWLHQAAAGQVPHGGISCDVASNAENNWKKEILLSSPSVPEMPTTKTAGTTQGEPSTTATYTDTMRKTINE